MIRDTGDESSNLPKVVEHGGCIKDEAFGESLGIMLTQHLQQLDYCGNASM